MSVFMMQNKMPKHKSFRWIFNEVKHFHSRDAVSKLELLFLMNEITKRFKAFTPEQTTIKLIRN